MHDGGSGQHSVGGVAVKFPGQVIGCNSGLVGGENSLGEEYIDRFGYPVLDSALYGQPPSPN